MKSYPLQWPSGWRRTTNTLRKRAAFNSKSREGWRAAVSISGATQRVLQQLRAFGVSEGDAIISTNLKLRLDGLPKGDQGEPVDPGVAVYWQRAKDSEHKVMAVDRYDRVADNLAAIAATLEAMRAIERHGGAVILERAFTGFLALPAPNTWRDVMDISSEVMVSRFYVEKKFKQLAKARHPDNGGSDARMAELNWAWAEAQKELS